MRVMNDDYHDSVITYTFLVHFSFQFIQRDSDLLAHPWDGKKERFYYKILPICLKFATSFRM